MTRNQYIRLIAKSVLVFAIFRQLFFVAVLARTSFDLDYFLFLFHQIRSRSYFKPPDEIWLAKSLQLLQHHAPSNPVTQQEYTQIVQHVIQKHPHEENEILQAALQSLVDALPDPYSAFLTPREVTDEETQKHGKSYPGFGLIFAQNKNGIELAGVLPDSPAEKAGISPGDFVFDVNGKSYNKLTDMNSAIHPENGGSLFLTLKHAGKRLSYTLHPSIIHMTSFFQKKLKQAGYIKMDVIVPGNDLKFRNAVTAFEKNGDPYLVLDFRNCIGGDLYTAARIAGFLLQPDDIIYYQESSTGTKAYANGTSANIKIPVYVLTNHATASAAELIAGALQDHRRATVIGQTSIGKGTIQSTWTLRNGGAIRLTTGVYLTPSRKKVVGVGIMPDVEHDWKKGESEEALEGLIDAVR